MSDPPPAHKAELAAGSSPGGDCIWSLSPAAKESLTDELATTLRPTGHWISASPTGRAASNRNKCRGRQQQSTTRPLRIHRDRPIGEIRLQAASMERPGGGKPKTHDLHSACTPSQARRKRAHFALGPTGKYASPQAIFSTAENAKGRCSTGVCPRLDLRSFTQSENKKYAPLAAHHLRRAILANLTSNGEPESSKYCSGEIKSLRIFLWNGLDLPCALSRSLLAKLNDRASTSSR